MFTSQKMFSGALGYVPPSKRKKLRETRILPYVIVFVGAVALWIFFSPERLGPTSSAMDNYQRINPYPMIHQDYDKVATQDRAVVSTMYTDTYVFPLAVLGHTLRQHHVEARRILIYLPDRISNWTLCFVKAAGWELHPVEFIPPPHGGKGIHWTFVDQYAKLNIWKLDQLGVKTAVYLDADTIVRRNFDEIWNLPFEFGAVPDVFVNDPGFTPGFNAGVLLFHPSTEVFNDMISKLETTKFRLKDAEQSYLNQYFGAEVVRLPYAYGGNLAIKERAPEMWKAMQEDMRIVHYTLVKPFNPRPKCWRSTCKPEDVLDLKKQQAWYDKAKTKWGGNFVTELTWWDDIFKVVLAEIGDLCPA